MSTPLSNTYYKLTVEKSLKVAFLGGSITSGGCATEYSKNYVSHTERWLHNNFPQAKIKTNNAGVGNTGSNYGIFRLQKDILDVFVPDLIFIEYTSNDWGRFGELNISRQNESIMRMLYKANPKIDIVFLFTAFTYESPCRSASTKLAEHYGLITMDPGKLIKTKIDTEEGGEYSKYTHDKIHPNDTGHALYGKMIGETFSKYLVENAPEKAEYLDVEVPEPLNKNGLFLAPEMVDVDEFDYSESFMRKDFSLELRQMKYDHYIETEKEGAEFTFDFDGTGFGLYIHKNPTLSNFFYSVDGGEFKEFIVAEMQNYDHGQTYIIEYDLPKGKHTVCIRNGKSEHGTTLRIIKVLVNK